MSKIKIEIKSIFGKVLFTYEKEANTIKDTLVEAIRCRADLRGADLREADLSGADLREADLCEADLREAYLPGADLCEADLREADLRGTYLSGADLSGADLRGADLREADLSGADLRGADLRGAENSELVIAQTRILPEGDIIGYKKCSGGVIVKLLIPKEAKRLHSFRRKCRAEYAEVLEIYGAKEAYSSHDPSFKYEIGKRVEPNETFNEDFTNECSSGIHFFITKIEAENY